MKKKGLYEFKVMGVRRDSANMEQGKWSATDYRFYVGIKARVTAAKRGATVRVNRVKKTTGYQVLYGTDKSLAKKTVRTFKGAGRLQLRVKGMKSGKRYYVAARPYKVYKGHKYIGVMSTKKRVKAR